MTRLTPGGTELNRTNFQAGGALAAVASAIAVGAALPAPAFGQAVADRTLSDVKVENVGTCSTLTINFNIRVQMLSYFPTEDGQEVHIRVRPLDPGAGSKSRESLRTPASVSSLRSILYEGDSPSGPVLSLYFKRDMRFQVEAGREAQSLVVRLSEPGGGARCEPSGAGQVVAPPVAGLAIPEGLYVVNVLSRPEAIGSLSAEQKALLKGHVLYETLFERDSQQWHRLREGFYPTREAAETERARLAPLFADAFVVKVSADERAQGVASRIDDGAAIPAPVAPQDAASEAETAAAAQLIADAELAIRDGNNDRAVQLLTNALQKPENVNTPRALELLGLTRERKGQGAQAQAEYQEYLRRYPAGEASDRVRQRLAAITSPTSAPEQLRQASGSAGAAAWSWGVRGSFSQFYFRDQSTTKFIDASRPEVGAEVDNSVNLNQLLTSGDVTISGGNDQRQVEMRAAGSHTWNFRKGGRDIDTLTALYADYSDATVNASARVGRQTRNTSGVLGRFDGLLLGWQAQPKLRMNLVAGFPVLTSRQTHILKDRRFYGASVDIGGKRSPLQTTLYWFDQRTRGGFIDRQSAGIEARVLLPRFNAFTIVDFDVKYSKLNLGLLTLNYSFPDDSNLSVTADYRQSPLLTTSNALIGQMNLLTLEPITDLRGLRPFFTDSEIYKLADDRTLVTKSLTASYSRPISKALQASVDFTMTRSGGTPETPATAGTGAILALPASATEYYYGAQLVGSGLLWSNDIYILSGRYSDTERSRSWTADLNARVPVSAKFRLNPRVRYGARSDKLTTGNYRQFQPTLRMNWYPASHSEVEIEIGGNFSRQRDIIAGSAMTTRESGVVLSAGYRIDF